MSDQSKNAGNEGDLVKHPCWIAVVRQAMADKSDCVILDAFCSFPSHSLPRRCDRAAIRFAKDFSTADIRNVDLRLYRERFAPNANSSAQIYAGSAIITSELLLQKANCRLILNDTSDEALKSQQQYFQDKPTVAFYDSDGFCICKKQEFENATVLIDPFDATVDELESLLPVLNQHKTRFMLWLPLSQGRFKDGWRQSQQAEAKLAVCREFACVHTVQWTERKQGMSGCLIATSKHHSDVTANVVEELSEKCDWQRWME